MINSTITQSATGLALNGWCENGGEDLDNDSLEGKAYVVPFLVSQTDPFSQSDLDCFRRFPSALGFIRPIYEGELESLVLPAGYAEGDMVSLYSLTLSANDRELSSVPVAIPPEAEWKNISHVYVTRNTSNQQYSTLVFRAYSTRQRVQVFLSVYPGQPDKITLFLPSSLFGKEETTIVSIEFDPYT